MADQLLEVDDGLLSLPIPQLVQWRSGRGRWASSLLSLPIPQLVQCLVVHDGREEGLLSLPIPQLVQYPSWQTLFEQGVCRLGYC